MTEVHMSIIGYLENNGLKYSDKVALAEVSNDLVCHKKSITWQEFDINANKM